MAGRTVRELLKIIAMPSVWIAICISKAILKWSLRHISKLKHIGNLLRQNSTERSSQSLRGSIFIDGEDFVVPLPPLSLAVVCTYKRSLNSENTVLVELIQAYFESKKWATSFVKAATKKKVLDEVSNNDVLKSRGSKSLSNICSSRRRTAWEELFPLLGYQRLVRIYSASTYAELL